MAGRARKLPMIARRRARRALNRALDRVEVARADPSGRPLSSVPFLIVGAPRSGSTLLYQLVVERFDIAYLSNRHCSLYGAPSLVERLGARSVPPAEYTSARGQTEGAGAPSECGEYWYRFFRRRPQYVSIEDVEVRQLRRLRGSVRALTDAARRPVVFKNLICALRLEPIGRALPEALFLVIRRDLLDNAHSILVARRQAHGAYEDWWSAEPPGVDDLRSLPASAQAAEQVRAIEGLIDEARLSLGADRFFDVGYEDLCADPRGRLAAFSRFAESHGTRLAIRRDVPERFDRKRTVDIDGALYAELSEYVRGLEA